MRAIGRANTRPELIVRKALHAAGLRFKLHVRSLPGTPDIVLPRHRCVVFVHGCFWHGHGCHLFKIPSTRTDFWLEKIGVNRVRDVATTSNLIEGGWRVMAIWECAIKGPHRLPAEEIAGLTLRWIQSEHPVASIDSRGLVLEDGN